MKLRWGYFLFAAGSLGCNPDAHAPAERVARSTAALTINSTADGNQLAGAILGDSQDILIFEAVYTGAPAAAGVYFDGPLAIPNGAILTTGSAIAAMPPDDGPSTGVNNGRAGDPLCTQLVPGYATYDAAKLSIRFSVNPNFTGISLLSIFGSEEYPEWVSSAYNDVVGVYLDDQQILLDSSQQPISINGGFFSSGNVVVSPATMSEYDGSTGILQTQAPLTFDDSGEHWLHIVICDGGDGAYDSGLFITSLRGCVGSCDGTVLCAGMDADVDGVNACDDCDDTDPAVGACSSGSGGGGNSGGGNGNGNGNGNGGNGNGNGNGGNGNGNGNGCKDAAIVDGDWVRFTYDRPAAISAAVSLSGTTPDGVQHVPTLPHYSGFFMSLGLRAGDLPMVDLTTGSNDGWNASLQGGNGGGNGQGGATLNGSSPWNSHAFLNDLATPQNGGGVIGYISGSGANGLPSSSQFEFNYAATNNHDTIVRTHLVADDGTFSFQNLLSINTTYPWLTSYQPGDYLYIDSAGVPHGFMIVGYERPISCSNTYLSKVDFRQCGNGQACSIDGRVSFPAGENDGLPDAYDFSGVRVPYVVDWNTGLQTQTPRPFYCSASRGSERHPGQPVGGDPPWFDHSFWMFNRVPSHGRVASTIYMLPNFQVTTNGTIHPCPAGNP